MAAIGQKQQVETKATEVAGPILLAEGLELVEVMFVQEHAGWVLRLTIDKPGGVDLEDCTRASRAVEAALEVEAQIPHEYHLEVSSPGLERPLTRPDHFRKAIGKKIKVKTFGPIVQGERAPRKKFSGQLTLVSDEAVTLEVEGAGTYHIPFKDIAKANLEFEF